MKRLDHVEVLSTHDTPGDWLTVTQQVLRNHYEDGTTSASFKADSAHRRGIDAVAVAPWRRRGGVVEVCLRAVLRPGVTLRARLNPPVPDPHPGRPMLWEIPAGIPEADEPGLDGLARCGAREVYEEIGLTVAADALRSLGYGTYPSGGILAEMLFLYAVEVPADAPIDPPPGDGTPFEEAGDLRWWPLPDALAACLDGRIVDAKTEIALHRLTAQLAL